jgi:pimeloyl-ACP methyl ester carboxylesterase
LLRRYLETRGVIGGHAEPHATSRLLASDGTRLVATYLPGPSTSSTAVLVAHGFAAHRRKPAYARLADGLSHAFPVLSLDLRGHGGSGGVSTLGDREHLDVRAGLDWLHAVGHDRVVAVGSSMGATAVLHAASLGAPFDAVVTVSGPAWFRAEPDTEPLRRLHTLWEGRAGRAGLRWLLGVRVAGPAVWQHPPHPAQMASNVRVPLLAVHGADDGYFPPGDADALRAAARGPSVVWHEPAGFGHAEDGLNPEFVHRLATAIGEVARTGRFPVRGPVRGPGRGHVTATD